MGFGSAPPGQSGAVNAPSFRERRCEGVVRPGPGAITAGAGLSGDQEGSSLTFLVSREIFLDAVLLCRMPLLTALSRRETASL